MGEPLRVDPAALSGAGAAVAEVSSGVATAVGALTVSYNANTGQDAAGTSFGFAYQDSAGELVKAVATGVNALRHIGYLVQGSATNYSRAEAAADIGGGAAPLPAPTAPAEFPAPGGDPDVNGPGESPPVLWYLVEFLVGDWWPNGSPGELRAAAAAWSVFATPLYGVAGQVAGPCGVIDAQQMPDKEPMKKAVLDASSAMSSLAGEAQKLAGELSGFATDVATTQNAIRDLLDKLSSVVGSIVDKGVLGTVFELVTGDAEEKIHEVANDIKAVIANHKRQSAARKELLADLVTGIKNYSRAMEIIMRVEFVDYLGEDAGRVVANVFDAFTDTNVGVALGGINTVGSIAAIDPIGDPKGTWAMIEGLGKMAEILNPMTAPMAFATDPEGSLDMVKDLTHYDDLTSGRPFLGIGQLGFDVGTAIIPGGAGARAAGGARAAEGAAARAEISATERAAGEAGGIASAAGGLRGVSRDLEGVTAKLDDLNKAGLDGGKPPSGSPGPLPKPGEFGPPTGPREPGPAPKPGAPTPPSQGHGAGGPTERVPGDTGTGRPGGPDVPKIPGEPKPSIVDVPPTAAERQAMAAQYEEGQVVPAGVPPSGAGEGSALPSARSAGSMEGVGAHGGEASSWAAGGASDRVPVSVGAHGAEGAADGAGHGPHPGAGDGGGHGGGGTGHGDGPGGHGGGGSHGGSGDDGGSPADHPTPDAPHPLPPDSPLFDGYEPHDPGPEFTDPDGNLIYPDDTDPAKPYAVPGTVVPDVQLARGTLMDRFGFPGGAWLSPAGTPFPFRGLPDDSALKPYFQYVVNDPTKLPPGWSIEQSQVAPWFHQPGGGVQYRIIAPEGERPSVQTLLDWGYLREVHK